MGENTDQLVTQDEIEYAKELQGQLNDAQTVLVATQGAHQSFMNRLTKKYGLREGDVINDDGTITRATDKSGE